MYGLPVDFDPAVLRGEELVQVCVGQSDLILNFEPRLSILVTSAVAYAPAGGRPVTFASFPEAGRELLALLGDTVDTVSLLNGRTLQLHFRTGASLAIVDDSDRFESYTIKRGDRLIVV